MKTESEHFSHLKEDFETKLNREIDGKEEELLRWLAHEISASDERFID